MMARDKEHLPWGDIDRSLDPTSFVGYLDTCSGTESVQTYKRQILAFLDIHEGDHVLEVGCGTGDDARAMAKFVGSTGRVVGVDSSAAMVAEARKHAQGQRLPVEYIVADAHHLDFADGTFNCCRADRTFQHLEDPRRALAEVTRVARRGARIVVVDPDWGTLAIDAPDRDLTKKITDSRSDRVRNGWMGRQLFGLFQEAGLAEVMVTPIVWTSTNFELVDQLAGLHETAEDLARIGGISAVDAKHWFNQVKQAAQGGQFFGAISLFIASGRKR